MFVQAILLFEKVALGSHVLKLLALNLLLFFLYLQVDIYSLSRNWKGLVDKARAKQLKPEEFNSGLISVLYG